MSKTQEMDYRSPEWVAEQLGLEKNTVYKYLQEGVIPALQLGRKWLISEADLLAWLTEETSRQTEARRKASTSASRTVRRMQNLTVEARNVVKSAHSHARSLNHEQLGELHILMALAARQSPVADMMADAGLTIAELQARSIDVMPRVDGTPARRLGRTPTAKVAMHAANATAAESGRKVTPADILQAIRQGTGPGAEILKEHGISLKDLQTQD